MAKTLVIELEDCKLAEMLGKKKGVPIKIFREQDKEDCNGTHARYSFAIHIQKEEEEPK